MNLTTEQIEKILNGAPDGTTHYENEYKYLKAAKSGYMVFDTDGGDWDYEYIGICETHNLSDLREILALRQRVKELEDNHAKAYEERQTEHRQLKPCYECGTPVHELSPRSRCCMCEYNRAIFNEEENNQLRGQDYE